MADGPLDSETEDGWIENRPFDEIAIGDTAAALRTLTADDIRVFAQVSGDINPAHLDASFAKDDLFHGVIANGMWGGALISSVLGTQLPGPGTVYIGQTLGFCAPVRPGDTITTRVTVTARDAERFRITLDCECRNQDGETVISGEAVVLAPRTKLRMPAPTLPDVRVSNHDRADALLAAARQTQQPIPTAVVHPASEAAMLAVAEAAAEGLITPILIGPEAKLRAAAAAAGVDLKDWRIDPVAHSHAAAARGVALVRDGTARLLMKGSLHTDELMGAVVAADTGLRTERRISHCYLMDVPGYPRPLIITDAAINIAPGLEAKADIIRNSIDLAHVIGIAVPRVAILAAVETVDPAMPATLDAAALCKMADRGQIVGGLLDGPLAFDNAISEAAARDKGIASQVAGLADILVVPNIEAGNMLAKQLSFMGGADAAGVVLGARVPIILTSRADSVRTRLSSVAVAVLLARAATKAAPGLPERP